MFSEITNKELKGLTITDEELVSYVANEYFDGAVQALFNEEEIDDGMHYKHALILIEENPKRVMLEFNLDKGTN
tara:strand:+ start:248 stop:469 length:222 start_codon:yes stop_codon:yes gene_type:complete